MRLEISHAFSIRKIEVAGTPDKFSKKQYMVVLLDSTTCLFL